MRYPWLVLAIVMLTACAPRGLLTVDPQAVGVGAVTPIFVGTTRAIDPAVGLYGNAKSDQVRFGRFDVSVPPQRDLGKITWPGRGAKANPQTDFVTTRAELYADDRAFSDDLRQDIMAGDNPEREVVIFVHGFNTTFSEGLYRLAQLSNDLGLPGSIVHYSWPSIGNPLGYVHDRDAVLFARDGLEQLLGDVRAAGAKRIYLVGHSMGAHLTMEALRQIAIRGDRNVLDIIGAVILISPDIDVDVFRSQARAIGTLPDPFVIFGSSRDFFLKLSSRLTGEPERLGNLSDLRRVSDLKVTFFEVSNYSKGAGHFTIGNSPTLIRLLDRALDVGLALERDARNRVGLLPGALITVRNATEVVLAPVVIVGDELLGR